MYWYTRKKEEKGKKNTKKENKGKRTEKKDNQRKKAKQTIAEGAGRVPRGQGFWFGSVRAKTSYLYVILDISPGSDCRKKISRKSPALRSLCVYQPWPRFDQIVEIYLVLEHKT